MTIRTELNPYLETLGLLYLSAHPEKASRSFLVSEANELGIDGDALYRKFGPVHKRYVSAFQKQWNREEILCHGRFRFFLRHRRLDSLPPLRMRRASPLVCPKRFPFTREKRLFWPLSIRILTDRTVTKVPSLSELLSLLEQSGLSTALCWKMTLLLQSPCPGSVNSLPLSKRACPPINTHRKPLPFHWESCLPHFPIRNIPPPPWKTRRYLRLSWFSLPWKPS